MDEVGGIHGGVFGVGAIKALVADLERDKRWDGV
jgi:hypothetical protein